MKRVEHLLSPFVRRRCGTRGRVFRLTARLAALTAGLNVALTRAADQPQWGELFSRNMVSSETGLPESFDPATGRHVRWIAEIGTETHATPIVAGGRVYIGTNNGRPRDPRHVGDRGVLMCL
ncbi:MAG: PQQ-binding-like beta-propeller repeat protein, partial [Kiritimatiellia bacterium]|nr:PQQ-binding-like beta-propeller repeat protein [Kiritimatiellia bacterium]